MRGKLSDLRILRRGSAVARVSYHSVPLVEAPTANASTDVGDLSRILDAAASGAVAGDIVADTIDVDAADIIAAVTAPGLSDDQRAILDFERRWWRQAGAKEQAIRDRFEISPTRYYQRLNALIDVPDALAYDATLVNRLRRLRSSGQRGRRLGPLQDAVG